MKPYTVVIPARYQSTRLPGKPLCRIAEKPMILHVVEAAFKSHAARVVVATDDERIMAAVNDAGYEAVMTSAAHVSGTDRLAEAVSKLALEDTEIVVNVQGDEPDMPPELIDQVAQLLYNNHDAVMATLSAAIDAEAQFLDPGVVKVVCDQKDRALYFSRAAIPHRRQDAVIQANVWQMARRHLGIYAYHAGYLPIFSSRPECPLEALEKLEQLRCLWYGETIICAQACATPGIGVDTLLDLQQARLRME